MVKIKEGWSRKFDDTSARQGTLVGRSKVHITHLPVWEFTILPDGSLLRTMTTRITRSLVRMGGLLKKTKIVPWTRITLHR